jgi:hypothetical protein
MTFSIPMMDKSRPWREQIARRAIDQGREGHKRRKQLIAIGGDATCLMGVPEYSQESGDPQ